MNRLSRVDPDIAAQVPDLPRIVAFRNVLVHGHAVTDNELVWQVAVDRVPQLGALLQQLLDASDGW